MVATPSPVPPAVATALAGCRVADERLSAEIDGLTDEAVGAPSLLPGWTVGHVLTHLARNAEGFLGVTEGLLRGERVAQYPGGAAQRRADIDAGAARPAAAIVADLRAVSAALAACWAEVPASLWADGVVAPWADEVPLANLPQSRWRELQVHHADLGLAFTPADWPIDYVRAELPVMLGRLAGTPDRFDDDGARAAVLALYGRSAEPVVLPPVVD